MRADKQLDDDELSDEDPRIVAAVKDFMAQLEAGKAPALETFLSEHADIAGELRPALEGLALVFGAAEKPKIQVTPAMPERELAAKPIGDFQIVGELGRGGMGIVYEAIQLSLGRRVALKVLPFASGLDASRLQRFRNEAHAAAQLHHTNIVPVYAVGSDRGLQYYAMQLIEGHTLAELISSLRKVNSPKHSTDAMLQDTESAAPAAKDSFGENSQRDTSPKSNAPMRGANRRDDGSKSLQSTLLTSSGERMRHYRSMVQLAHQACLALEHAHQYGVVHRDIKPGNLLLDGAGKLWVTDFGLAQIEQGQAQLTRSGDALGTVRYMSPEQAAGNRMILDHRTDIYSLGVTLYELLTLEPAIRGQDYRDMLNQVAEREPLTPKQVDPALPMELDTIVRKAIAKEPGQRYATAGDFASDLLAWLDDKPIAAKPPTVWEWLAKWRKRNSRLVNVAAGLLLVASLGLLFTTLMVLREQQITREALASENRQRIAAEASFQQARRAVDTFSELSETELAYRPEFQNLRRRILETSLEFYRDFLAQQAGDLNESQELVAASQKVERLVADLKLLDDVAPLLLLVDSRVRQELQIAREQSSKLLELIRQLQTARDDLEETNGPLLAVANTEIAGRLREFVEQMYAEVDEAQMNRLRQISRQQQLPFTFLTTETSAALNLSNAQRQQISKIFQEERFDRRGPPDERPDRRGRPPEGRPGGDGFGPIFGGPPRGAFGGGDGPPPWKDRRDDPGREGPGREGPGREGPGREGPGREGPRGPNGQRDEGGPTQEWVTQTVARVLEVLSPAQRTIWYELIGEPFAFQLRWQREYHLP